MDYAGRLPVFSIKIVRVIGLKASPLIEQVIRFGWMLNIPYRPLTVEKTQ
jgi:hypothetical protein